MLNKTWPADVNWSWGKCGTGQGDSSKGASPSGWKTPTGVEFARSPVFNTTSSLLLVKQIRLHAVLWRSEMSAFVLVRVWRLQLDWIGDDTQCERSGVWPPCGVKAGQVMLVMGSGSSPTWPHFLVQGSARGRSAVETAQAGRECSCSRYYHIISSSHHVVKDIGLNRAAAMRAHTCKSKHALVFTCYVAEKFSNGSSGVDVDNLWYTTIATVLYFM